MEEFLNWVNMYVNDWMFNVLGNKFIISYFNEVVLW